MLFNHIYTIPNIITHFDAFRILIKGFNISIDKFDSVNYEESDFGLSFKRQENNSLILICAPKEHCLTIIDYIQKEQLKLKIKNVFSD